MLAERTFLSSVLSGDIDRAVESGRVSAAEGDALVSEYVSAPSEEARAAVLSRAYRGLVVTQASRESQSQSLMTHDGVVDYAS